MTTCALASGDSLHALPGEGRSRTVPWAGTLVLVAVLGASALTLLITGEPALAAMPVLSVGLIAAVLYTPLRWSWYGLIGLVILADITPPKYPSGEVWISPVDLLRRVMLENLDTITGVQALRFSGAEVVFIVLVLIAFARSAGGFAPDASTARSGRDALVPWLVGAFICVIVMEAWGLATGGDFRQSLWQMRELLWLPVLTGIALYSIRRPEDLRLLLWTLTAVAALKIAIGFAFYSNFIQAAGTRPPMVTSHNDSVLFTAVIAMWLAAAGARPTRGRLTLAVAVTALMMVGIIINNRRTAFVSLLTSLVVFYLLLPVQKRRRVTRVAIYALPFIAAYVAIGQQATGGIFAPAAAIVSVFEQKDASSETRDVENYNLIYTLKDQKLIGSGWGHEYTELTKAYDISQNFEQYRYVAHNSVLWLWSLGGLVGFTALWLPFVVAIFLAARAHRHAARADDRAAASVAIVTVTIVLIEAWGDMGTQSWTNILIVACAFAVSAMLAAHANAWPAWGRPGVDAAWARAAAASRGTR